VTDLRTFYLHCVCGNLPHQARLLYDPAEPPHQRDLLLEVLLPRDSWRRRLVSAWRLLRNDLSPYGDVACIILDVDQARALIGFANDYLTEPRLEGNRPLVGAADE